MEESLLSAPEHVTWLLLSYKTPSEPTRHRMAVWRRLKTLGAVYLHNGVCLLPSSPEHLRQIKILANEIVEAKGEALLMEATALDQAQKELVIQRFRADRDDAFREFVERCDGFEEEIARETKAGKLTYAELEENDEDLKKLRTWYAKITALDFFDAPLGKEAAARLERCADQLEKFSQQVYEAHLKTHAEPGNQKA